MRIVIATVLLTAFAAPALGQSDPVQNAMVAFEECAIAKAEAFAGIEGSISEIATAAIGACNEEAKTLAAEYQAYNDSQSPVGAKSAGRGDLFLEITIKDLTPRLMAVIAEARN